MKCLPVLVSLLFLCVTVCADAQSTDATISGQVLDPSGKVIPDAEIEILNESTGVLYSGKTNGTGIYAVSILPPGQYRVQVSKIGFKTLIKPDVVLNVQSAVALNFTLPIGATSESVTIDAGASRINTSDASVSTVIDRKFVENIPLNGRSFQDLISMTPGVVTQSSQAGGSIQGQGDFSVNGQRTESNYYTVDGVSANVGAGYPSGYAQAANTGSIATSTALGTTQSMISVDALQEFRVSSSTYSAELGRSPGGQFSFSTRSGTNRLHGSGFDYLRNDLFDANDWFSNHDDAPKTALRQNDFGGTLGGPIFLPHLYDGRSRGFFFFSYEGLRLVEPTPATTQYVPSLAVRTSAPSEVQPVFNAFPLPTGPETEIACSASADNCPTGSPLGTLVPSGLSAFVAPYSLPSQIDAISVRIDQRLSDRMSMFFRLGKTPSSSQSRLLSSVNRFQFDTQSYTLGATNQLRPNLSNELRIGYTESRSSNVVSLDAYGGAVPIDLAGQMGVPSSYSAYSATPYIDISGVGTSYLEDQNASTTSRQWNITDIASLTEGTHGIRVGIDERHIVSPLAPPGLAINADFYTRQAMTSNTATDISIQKNVPSTPIFNEFAAFAQDEWRALPTLTVSMGLRWEVNPPPSEAHGDSAYTVYGAINDPTTLSLAPRGTSLWHTSWYNLAPRLGVAWTAYASPQWETVVRAGGGVFFDTGNQIATDGYSALGFYAFQDPTNVPLPITSDQFAFPTTPIAPYTNTYICDFPTHLQLPYSLQWNTSLQQAIGRAQTVTISYVASAGRRLLQEQYHSVHALNPNFGTIYYFPSGVTSNYQSLQVQFQRSVTHGIQALGSYTWSHSLDYGSTNASYPFTYGNSNFDLRHNFQGGISWDLPERSADDWAGHLLDHWGLDGRLNARTAFPITILGKVLTGPTGERTYSGVNYDVSKPEYVYGPQYPGGRAINGGPAIADPAFTLPTGTSIGNAPRNFVRAFGAVQLNAAIRREFRIHEDLRLQFRAESFNLLNHPNFGYVNPTLTNALFGQATNMLNQSLATMSSLYQEGGARSTQFSLRLSF